MQDNDLLNTWYKDAFNEAYYMVNTLYGKGNTQMSDDKRIRLRRKNKKKNTISKRSRKTNRKKK